MVLGRRAQKSVAANESRDPRRRLATGPNRLMDVANGREQVNKAEVRQPILYPGGQACVRLNAVWVTLDPELLQDGGKLRARQNLGDFEPDCLDRTPEGFCRPGRAGRAFGRWRLRLGG